MTPSAIACLIRMQSAITRHDVYLLAIEGVLDGSLTADEAVAALETWERINARAVQTVRSHA